MAVSNNDYQIIPLKIAIGIQYYYENTLKISNEKWKLIITRDVSLLLNRY